MERPDDRAADGGDPRLNDVGGSTIDMGAFGGSGQVLPDDGAPDIVLTFQAMSFGIAVSNP